MRDEHFYTRALQFTPDKTEYYLGRAEWYCIEHEYDKAYKDFTKAVKLGADVKESYKYKTCMDYIEADRHISDLSKEIEKNPDNYEFYCKRAKYYLLKREYKNAISDVEQAVQLNPCPYTFEFKDDLLIKIREFNVFDVVNNAKKKDLIKAYRLRLKLAQDNLRLCQNEEYWRKRAELDFDKIIELSKDKTLALYLKVNFFEALSDIRQFKNDNTYINNAIMYCKRVIEQSKNRTDTMGKTLTYLYEIKLVSLYSNEDKFEQAMQTALNYPEKPLYQDIKKGLKYINDFAFMHFNVLSNDKID